MLRQAQKPKIRKSTAQERFTDRRDPVHVFEEKYAEIHQEYGSIDVIHYYGEGGIGKSTLLCKIMDDQIEYGHKNVIMYSFRATQDKTVFLPILARQIGARIKHADFTVFYYAYAKYLNKCGMSEAQIEACIKSTSQTGIVVSETAKTAIGVLTDFLPIGGGVASKAGELIVDYISRLVGDKKKNGKREDKEAIYKIDRSSKDELEGEMQLYFAADCNKFMNDIIEPLVILLDDYEYMNDRVKHGNSHADLWLSDAYDGLVNLLPNTLWVIAGRDRVNWNEDVLCAENCHLLGALGEDDASDFFGKARDPEGEPMDPDLIRGLYNLTQGIPVYMDMCFGRFENGRCNNLDNFGKNTEDIAERYFKDREPEERTAIEFLCGLTGLWSDELRKNVLDRIESDEPYAVSLQLKLKGIKEQTYVEKMGDQYKIHDVYRKVVRDNMDKDELKKITNATYYCLADMIKDESLSKLERVKALRQLDQDIEDYLLIEDDIRDTILFNCDLPEDIGRYYEYYELALKLFEVYRKIENDHPINENKVKMLEAQSRYASSLGCVGQYKDALEMYKNVYEQRRILLTEDHPDTLAEENNLAVTYSYMGEHGRARELYEDVLKKQTKILGEDHPDMLSTKHNLAGTYKELGEYGKALELFKDVLKNRIEILGEDHPDTLATKNGLAGMYKKLGEYGNALELFKDVLKNRIEILGEDHPDTLTTKNGLAATYTDQGEYGKALELYEEVLEKQIEILGEDHPRTFITKNNLAATYSDMGEYCKALELYEEVLKKQIEMLGEDHPDTLSTKHNLAVEIFKKGEYGKALEQFKEVLKKRTELLGEDHPDTLNTKKNLERTFWEMKRKGIKEW